MAGEWISCSDCLPEIGKCVIAFDPDLWRVTGQGFHGAELNVGEWWGDHWMVAGGEANVTHWMPFPKKPDEAAHGR
jgi:hypothetical protein